MILLQAGCQLLIAPALNHHQKYNKKWKPKFYDYLKLIPKQVNKTWNECENDCEDGDNDHERKLNIKNVWPKIVYTAFLKMLKIIMVSTVCRMDTTSSMLGFVEVTIAGEKQYFYCTNCHDRSPSTILSHIYLDECWIRLHWNVLS